MDTVYRYYAALYASRPVTQYIKEGRTVVTKLTGNIYVPNPNPSLQEVTIHLNTLDADEQAAHHGPKGSAAKRNSSLLVVKGDMRLLRACVQVAADSDITNAQLIIESAGMYVARRAVKAKPDLAARYGGAPGAVDLVAKAFKGQGSYHWQMSNAQNAWVDLPPTVMASTQVTGLTPVTLYSFRLRTITKAGLSDWSTPVTIIAR